MTELTLNYSDAVSLKDIRVGFRCNTCGHTWAAYLSSIYKVPLGADVCTVCANNKKNATLGELKWKQNK